MTGDVTRERFRRTVLAVMDSREGGPEIDQEFKDALLAFGSESDGNIACVEHVKVGAVSRSGVGFSLRNSDIPIADVLNAAEESVIPDFVKEEFPAITQEDWNAVLRLCTLIFILFE
jgi:hypothetical protein